MPSWRLGVGFGVSETDLDFGAAGRFGATEYAATASLQYRLVSRVNLVVSAGALLGGTLQSGARTFDIDPGFVVAGGGSVVILDGSSGPVFVIASATLAFSFAQTTERVPGAPSTDLRGRDIRIGALAGHTFGPLNAYVAARGFSGGVDWTVDDRTISGGDAHHYQIGAGASVRLGSIDLIAEGMPLGERSLTLGAGWSF
jgi:hypothetical protein